MEQAVLPVAGAPGRTDFLSEQFAHWLTPVLPDPSNFQRNSASLTVGRTRHSGLRRLPPPLMSKVECMLDTTSGSS